MFVDLPDVNTGDTATAAAQNQLLENVRTAFTSVSHDGTQFSGALVNANGISSGGMIAGYQLGSWDIAAFDISNHLLLGGLRTSQFLDTVIYAQGLVAGRFFRAGQGVGFSATGNANDDYAADFGSSPLLSTGHSFGVRIRAGTNASDKSLSVNNKANTVEYLSVLGDGRTSVSMFLDVGLSAVTKPTGVLQDADVYSFQSRYGSTVASGTTAGALVYGEQQVASTGHAYAMQVHMVSRHPSGTVGTVGGIVGIASNFGNTTVTELRGINAIASMSGGSGGGTDAICFRATPAGRTGGATGSYTNCYALYIDAFGTGYTNIYSIYASDSNAYSFFNGPIQIGAGQIVSGLVGSSSIDFPATLAGGTGQPISSHQAGWVTMRDNTGAPIWIGFWR